MTDERFEALLAKIDALVVEARRLTGRLREVRRRLDVLLAAEVPCGDPPGALP